MTEAGYFVTFIDMFIVAFVISRLTLRVREQADAARNRERRTAALYNLSRELAHERKMDRLSAIAVKHIHEVFAGQLL
jgi:two-component system sensor histidine kinase KdpD